MGSVARKLPDSMLLPGANLARTISNLPSGCNAAYSANSCCADVILSPSCVSPSAETVRNAMDTRQNQVTQIAAQLNLAIQHHRAGRLAEAESIYRQILRIDPDHAPALHLLGTIASRARNQDAAIDLIGRAIRLKPSAPMYCDLGSAYRAHGKPEAALECFREALRLQPDFADAHNQMGATLHAQGRFDEAIRHYRKVLAHRPDYVEGYNNLGLAFQAQGKLEEAAEEYRQAIRRNPDFADAHSNLGSVLRDRGRLEEATAHYSKAAQLSPDVADICNNLGTVFLMQGKLEAAGEQYERALVLNPDYSEAHNNLGLVYQSRGDLDAAVACYRKAIALNADFVDAHNNLGNALRNQGKLDEAVRQFNRVIALEPGQVEVYNNLGNALRNMGRLDEAIASFHKALQLNPGYAQAYSSLLFLHAYHGTLEAAAYLSLARGWEQACVPAPEREAAAKRRFKRLPASGRRLKIGYVSGDFRQHAVSYFIEQLFARHDRSRVELYAYSTAGTRDAVTARLQDLTEHWVVVAGLSDTALRERIEADGIDVLIDLSGHTAHNRMGVFARRAAPVQVHYLGYFASTGLSQMDYFIGDAVLTPPEMDPYFSEQVWRLPRIRASYDGKADAPGPGWRPDATGTLWVGSFSNLGKLTPETFVLWARVLHALPEAKLLLKTRALADAGNRRRILEAMAAQDIVPERIELQSSEITPGWREHMAYYDRLDIALDPIGAHGGYTTTCDALWMGVPVITLEGDRMASRMTASILSAIGHPQWIATTEADYVDKVVALARDQEQRKALRTSQRELMAISAMCDAKDLARKLESACLEMFEQKMPADR